MTTINIDQNGRFAVIRVATGVVAFATDSYSVAQNQARNHGSASIVIDLHDGRVSDIYDGGGSRVNIGINGIRHEDTN